MTVMANYVAAVPYIPGNLTALFYKTWRFTENGDRDVTSFCKNISPMNIYVYHEIFMYFTRVVFPDHRKHNFLNSALNV